MSVFKEISPTRVLLSLPASMFYCLVASGLQEHIAPTGGLAQIVAILSTAFLACSISLWILADAQQRRRSVPYDFDAFVFFAWPVLVPIYLFSTRGWRGFGPLGCFVLLCVAAAGVSAFVGWLVAPHL